MNVNEVVASLASLSMGGGLGSARNVHPNDDVNLGQSSNDVFPTAMHIAAGLGTRSQLLPALRALHETLLLKSVAFKDVIKIGRTHWQDATPVTWARSLGVMPRN